jgi:hypothetical protein
MKQLLFLMMTAGLHAQTVTLTPVKDTDVYSYPGDGRPTSTVVSLGVNSTPPGAGLHSQRSLIQFDLSTLPFPASEIGSAVLQVFVLPTDPTYGNLAPGNVHVHRQATNWGTVTSNSPTWLAFQSAAELGTFYVPANSQETWLQFEMTASVAGWAGGSLPNHGIFLAPEADVMATPINAAFASMEVAGYQPRLIITRKAPLLAIASAGGMITLSWPVSGSEGWILQRNTNLVDPWTNHPATASIVGDQWQLQMPAASREFFRLLRN